GPGVPPRGREAGRALPAPGGVVRIAPVVRPGNGTEPGLSDLASCTCGPYRMGQVVWTIPGRSGRPAGRESVTPNARRPRGGLRPSRSVSGRGELTMDRGTTIRPTPPRDATAAGDSVDDLFRRAERAFRREEFDRAIPLYRRLLEDGIAPGLMLYRLGMIANALGDHESAWDHHCLAVAVDPALASKITPPDYPHHRAVC